MQVIMNIITYHTVGWATRNSISDFRRSGVISRTRSGGDNVCKIDAFLWYERWGHKVTIL